MLVLTRKAGEKIRINNDILITVDEIGPGRVKLQFHAPLEVRINREELYRRRCEDAGVEYQEVPR